MAKGTLKPESVVLSAATIESEEHLTSPGSALGTVAYMSPEQVRIVAAQASRDQTFKGRKLWVVLACIAVIGLAAVGLWYLRSGRAAQIDSIAVLPFTNGGGDTNTDYLSDGITESLINN